MTMAVDFGLRQSKTEGASGLAGIDGPAGASALVRIRTLRSSYASAVLWGVADASACLLFDDICKSFGVGGVELSQTSRLAGQQMQVHAPPLKPASHFFCYHTSAQLRKSVS